MCLWLRIILLSGEHSTVVIRSVEPFRKDRESDGEVVN